VTDAGWNPDPTGKHELRYWDGSAWTDHVSDAGVAGTDPLTPAAPEPTSVAVPPASTAPPATRTAAAPAPAAGGSSGSGNKPLLVIGGVLAVVVIAAAAFFLLGGDDGGRDVSKARAGLENILSDNDAPDDALDDPVELGDCPFELGSGMNDLITEADADVTDIDADTNLVVVFVPPDEQTLTCGLFAEDGDDGFFIDVYLSSFGEGGSAQDLVDLYNELGADTDVNVDLTDLGKAEGGQMFQACADQFLLPGDDPDDFIEDPYCDTVWVSDGFIVGVEQFGSQSIDADEAKAMVLFVLDRALAAAEDEA
jgi:hypothetical protein